MNIWNNVWRYKKKDKSFWYTVHEKTIKDKFIYKKVYSAMIIF